MDIEAYIESGLIESYVFGLATDDEIAQLEALRLQYAQINIAINDFSSILEEQAFSESSPPPPYLKNKIMAALQTQNESAPVVYISASQNEKQANNHQNNLSIKPWKMMAAASVILLVVSAALNFYFYTKYSEKREEYQALLNEKNTLAAANQVYQTSQQEWENTTKLMADSAMVFVKMKTAAGKNNNDATVFWNSQNKDVYVMTKTLPHPTVGKQFQLWAIVDGKPVDAGIINLDCLGVCKMKNIPHAQAFAITLENVGGSPAPHLDQLVVIGKI